MNPVWFAFGHILLNHKPSTMYFSMSKVKAEQNQITMKKYPKRTSLIWSLLWLNLVFGFPCLSTKVLWKWWLWARDLNVSVLAGQNTDPFPPWSSGSACSSHQWTASKILFSSVPKCVSYFDYNTKEFTLHGLAIVCSGAEGNGRWLQDHQVP